ncbi:hypothetical protein [Streptomyces sp. NPDC051662]|uniref:hypothetical protein n=1 Tax=Streptomyces sp. NPDC051662 TaxID=3154750 RepID=UPI00343D579D
MPESPLSQAADAKRRRDIGGEVSALMDGHRALTEAPWYPSRAGDLLVVTMEATGHAPRWTETYEVFEDAEQGRVLCQVGHTAPEADAGMAGWFAGPPELHGGDPFETPWMEAGADRLTVIRDGRIIYQGRHASSSHEDRQQSPAGGKSSDPIEGFVFTACQFLALDEDGRQVPGRTLDLSVHGWALYRPEPGDRGERFEVRLDLDALLPLPTTSLRGHDVHLWAYDTRWRAYVEVWLHRVAFGPAQRGAGWTELSGPGLGRSLHIAHAVPVPAAVDPAPAWWAPGTN